MEDNKNERLEAAGKRIREKVSSSSEYMGVADDYSNDNILGADSMRRNDGSVRYSSSVDDEKGAKRRVTKNTKRRRKHNFALAALIVFFVAVLAGCGFLIFRNNMADRRAAEDSSAGYTESAQSPEAPSDTASPAGTKTAESVKEEAVVTPSGRSVAVTNDKIHEGDLILVNYRYAYVFPTEDILLQMKPRAEHFMVSTLDVSLQSAALDAFVDLMNDQYENSGFDDVLVVSSFRGLEKQQEIYQDRVDRYGSEYAAAYVADPGYSEHHTGLAMDLSVYTNGESYDIEEYPDTAWFMENYDRYGYILRYPEHKAGITSINYEGWHYRYVGLPHSRIMDKNDLCLEEYTDYVKNYSFSSALCFDSATSEIKTVDAASYVTAPSESLVYFVQAADGGVTDIPLPETGEYTISGNNVDGFVVTIG